jgi:hypothetical protein
VFDGLAECIANDDPAVDCSAIDCSSHCDDDSSNDCAQDCAGVWGGTSINDACGYCTETADIPSNGMVFPATYCEDLDGDGYGNPDISILACTSDDPDPMEIAPENFVLDCSDCDDDNAEYVEDVGYCDCYGVKDYGCGCNDQQPQEYYQDFDNDGFGNSDNILVVVDHYIHNHNP